MIEHRLCGPVGKSVALFLFMVMLLYGKSEVRIPAVAISNQATAARFSQPNMPYIVNSKLI